MLGSADKQNPARSPSLVDACVGIDTSACSGTDTDTGCWEDIGVDLYVDELNHT